MTRITLSVALEIWRAFRSACIGRGLTASKEIERFMHQQVQSWQNEEKHS